VPLHAIEIVLARAIGALELRAAQEQSRLPLAVSEDSRRLVVLVSAKDERRAVRKIWKRLGDALPVDVLCSVFPSRDGTYLMSIPMEPETEERLRSHARDAAQTPEEYLRTAIAQALARDRSARRARLACALSGLFREFTPEEITAEAAQRISRI
jgi:predicted transcriptional regulator